MTKPTFFVEEDKILANLFEEGLENLHLYKPGASPMYSERLLTLLGDDYRNRITVHGHFYRGIPPERHPYRRCPYRAASRL